MNLLILIAVVLCIGSAQASTEDEAARARIGYTRADVEGVLFPHLMPGESTVVLTQVLDAMFAIQEDPHHPAATIMGGWKCLAERMQAARENGADDSEKIEGQILAILQTAAMHKKYLPDELRTRVEGVIKCQACMVTAKNEVMSGSLQ